MSTYVWWALIWLTVTGTYSAEPGIIEIKYDIGARQISFHILNGAGGYVQTSTDLVNWTSTYSLLFGGAFSPNEAGRYEWRFYRIKVGEQVSTNIAGYINLSIDPGRFYLLADPFRRENLAPFQPLTPGPNPERYRMGEDSKMYRWTPAGFITYTWSEARGWAPFPPASREPYYLKTTTPLSTAFYGDLTARTWVSAAKGLSMVTPPYPRPGSPDAALQWPSDQGARLYLFDESTGSFSISTFFQQSWYPPLSGYKPGRGLWLRLPEGRSWQATVPSQDRFESGMR